MIFRQLIHDDLGCASYLIGDEDAGIAAVVDPKFEIEDYLALARYLGVRIEHVLETHNHADHVSGHGRLAAATGAAIHINRLAEPGYENQGVEDGTVLELGEIRIRALHTPGHRPEHTAFVLTDTARGPEPWAVLSGDSLFIGDIARPDLAVDMQEGARGIYRSLHEKLLVLPATCEVWPGHLGGSLCGGPGMDMKVSSTIGFELAHNPLLRISDETSFIRETTSGLGPQPPNFEAIVARNRAPLAAEEVQHPPLGATQVQAKAEAGALLVDVRADREFDQAHIPGALCNPTVRAGFGTKLAWIAERERPVVMVGGNDSDAVHATHLAAAVGIDNVIGYLAGGMTTWHEEKRKTESVVRVDVPGLRALLDDNFQILDVRERDEWEHSHIPDSVHLPYHDIDAIPEGIDAARPIAVICTSGQRSAVAASLLQRHGARQVIHVADGGVATWASHGWPIEGSDVAGSVG